MDDLLALLDESPPVGEDESEEAPSLNESRASHHARERPSSSIRQTKNDTGHQQSMQQPSPAPAPSAAEKLALSVDDRVGIRMINRKISGLDLMNLITDHPFHSPATLSASSLANLNRMLADPAAVIDAATVCGKTSLVTVGLVFSNSGTRVASSGNAFCNLQIGNLNTGPTVTVLLFGSCYSKYCRTLKAGKVVALVNPRLLPSKNGGAAKDTSITLTVNDESQLMLVADARDFGFCKAMVRGKNHAGAWVSNGKACHHFVDTRVGLYCAQHRRQQQQKGGTMSTSALQQLQLQAREFPTVHGNTVRTMTMGRETTAVQNNNNNNKYSGGSFQGMTQRQIPIDRTTQKLVGNSILNPRGHQQAAAAAATTNPGPTTVSANLISNPLAATRSSSRHPVAAATTTGSSNINPYAAANPRIVPRGPSMKKKMTATMNDAVVTGNILQQPAKKGRVEKRRRTIVNTDTVGFNGSVRVPGPSKIFSRTAPLAASSLSPSGARWKHEKSVADVLAKQQLVAARLRERKEAAEKTILGKTAAVATNGTKTTKQQQKRDGSVRKENAANNNNINDATSLLLFEGLGEIDHEQVMKAQSRFAHEADAEEYARSRRVVSELEVEEAKKQKTTKATDDATSKKRKQGSQKVIIEKEWRCLTCKRTFPKEPVACIRCRHKVKVIRSIRATKTKSDERQELTDKRAEDGGLKVGSGLDWSRNYSRFS